ncbi:ROK family protein [Streptomyces sp. NPDC048462]|uniref:ROK family protein n=1 Tax=Streptomyces sp. NPDC048462 TaxID=3365555 RepID=UPI0037129E2E
MPGVRVPVDNDVNVMALADRRRARSDALRLLYPKVGTGIGCGVIAGHVVAPVRSAQPADEFTRAVTRPLKASLKRVNASAGTDTRASGSSRYPFGAHLAPLTRLATGRRCGCCQERALE